MKWIIIILVLFFLIPLEGLTQESENQIYQFDSVGVKSVRFVALPLAFYTPETSFGFGGGAQIFLLRKANIYNDRQSNIFVSAIYTINKQFVIDIKPQLYFGKGDYFLDGAFKFQVFPNSFWGIGNETLNSAKESYNMRSTEIRGAILKRLPPKLNFGFEYILEKHDVTEVQEGGLLEEGSIEGSDGALVSGLGAIFNLDSRDNIGAPLEGYFLQLSARFSSVNFGATSGYNKFIFDLRTYQKLGRNGIIAIQLYQESTLGNIPFQDMAWFGGGEKGRGYFRGRFIDNHQYVLQAEYRWRFKPRWTLAAFALVGEVAERARDFLNDLKPSTGGGIRFKLVKDQDTWLRLDVGVGRDGSSGVYFGVNEAF